MIKRVLSNGIRVVAEKMTGVRSVSFGIWVKNGSRNEEPQQNGISHFIEHMLFKGTKRYSAKEIADVFDGIGGNVNAFTTKEYTCFYAKVLDEHLPVAVDVLADMLFHSTFDPEEMEKERNVILEEIAMYEDTPDDLVHDLLAKAAFGSHPLGRTILGTPAELNRMTPDSLREYMRERYNARSIVISLAGNFDDGVFDLLERVFGSYDCEGSAPVYDAPEFVGDAVFREKDTEQNHLCLAFPGCPLGDKRSYPMILLNNALGGGMSSRLFQEIREKRGLVYSVYSYHSAYVDGGMFVVYAGMAPKHTAEVLKLTIDMIGRMMEEGISEEELRKGKEQMKGSLILGLESTGSRMNRNGKNELMLGRHESLDEVIARIENVQAEDIRSLARNMFSRPFAVSMVGRGVDKVISTIRRDQLASHRPH